jgi:hypothetical protein
MEEGSIRWFWQGLRRLFPSGWAASTTNILTAFDTLLESDILKNDAKRFDALLLSFGYGLSKVYNDIISVQEQIYLQSATGTELDLIAQDYFGNLVVRTLGQSDDSFRTEIEASFAPLKVTVLEIATKLFGSNFRLLNQTPQQQAWNISNWGYNSKTACWASRTATAQVFLQVPRLNNSSDMQAAFRALALAKPFGVRVWLTSQVSGPPQPAGGVQIKHVLPKYSVGAPFIIKNVGLALLLGGVPAAPYSMSPSSFLAAFLNPQASSPTILNASAALLTALG